MKNEKVFWKKKCNINKVYVITLTNSSKSMTPLLSTSIWNKRMSHQIQGHRNWQLKFEAVKNCFVPNMPGKAQKLAMLGNW